MNAATWLTTAAVVGAIPAVPSLTVRPGLPLRGERTWRMPRLPIGEVLVAFAVVIAFAWRGVPSAIASALLATSALMEWRARCRAKRATAVRAGQLAALRTLAAELQAGAGEAAALQAAAEEDPDNCWLQAAGHARAGDSDALVRELSARPDLSAVAAAWRVRARTGAGLVEVINRVVVDLEERSRRARLVEEVSAGPRASAMVVALLPGLGIVLGVQVGAHPVGFLTQTSAGGIVLVVGAAMSAAGIWWTRLLISRGGGSESAHPVGARR